MRCVHVCATTYTTQAAAITNSTPNDTEHVVERWKAWKQENKKRENNNNNDSGLRSYPGGGKSREIRAGKTRSWSGAKASLFGIILSIPARRSQRFFFSLLSLFLFLIASS
jgi:hypothetical protein